jgi:hypothetical protein
MTCKYSPLFKAATFSACLSLLEIFFSFIISDHMANDANAQMLRAFWLVVVFIFGMFWKDVQTAQTFCVSCGKFCRRSFIINRAFLPGRGLIVFGSNTKHPAFRQSGIRSVSMDFPGNSRSLLPGTVYMHLVSQPGWSINEMFDCLIKPNHYETDFADKL